MSAMPSFEFCAFEFLRQWLDTEQALHVAFSTSPTEDKLREALAYFQVARTFTGLSSPGKVHLVLQSLIDVCGDSSVSTPYEKVDRLANRFRQTFGKYNVSAASKLLWLTYRDPFIIYDTRAVTALKGQVGHTLGDYIDYCEAWRKEYERSKNSIRIASQQLPKGRLFMRSCPLTDSELLEMAQKTWFTERVFDVFLWEAGIKSAT